MFEGVVALVAGLDALLGRIRTGSSPRVAGGAGAAAAGAPAAGAAEWQPPLALPQQLLRRAADALQGWAVRADAALGRFFAAQRNREFALGLAIALYGAHFPVAWALARWAGHVQGQDLARPVADVAALVISSAAGSNGTMLP